MVTPTGNIFQGIDPTSALLGGNMFGNQDGGGFILGALKQQMGMVAQPKMTLLQALGNVIAIEDQQWLSQPAILNDLPNFITNEVGVKLVTEFISKFKEYSQS